MQNSTDTKSPNSVRTRFAPSPTGYLHIGGLRTALYAYLYAKSRDGSFILRIEDTDLERYVDGSVEIIYRTLKDSGLVYDEGPDVGGAFGPYVQSLRKDIYLEYAQKLIESGTAYYCFCTKERLTKMHEGGATKYDKHCLRLSTSEIKKNLAAGLPYCIRQNIPESGLTTYTDMVFGDITVENKDLEDNVLIKSDGMPTYNFANVVDDHLMQITHVIRGTEYLSSTPKYNLLYDAFGWEHPQYMHLPPIMKDATRKLSKRYGDASYEDFITKGYLKEAIVNYIALLGWSPKNDVEKMSLSDMKAAFSVEGLSKSAAIFDETKMRWLNALYIKDLSAQDFCAAAAPWLDQSAAAGKYDYGYLAGLLHSRVEILSQIPDMVAFLEQWEGFDTGLFVNQKWKTDTATAKQMLPDLISVVENCASFEDSLHDDLTALVTRLGVKNGQVLWTFRIAIAGAAVTPGGATEMAILLGKERTLCRLKKALARL